MIEHLLVYGTLAPGESNHYMMKDIPGVWKTAYFKGTVLKKDWGKLRGIEREKKIGNYIY